MDDTAPDVLEAVELALESLDGLSARLFAGASGTEAHDDVARRTLAAVERIAAAMVRLEGRVGELTEQVAGAVDPPVPAAGPVRAAFWAPPARLRSIAG